jgi:hypothetical protein
MKHATSVGAIFSQATRPDAIWLWLKVKNPPGEYVMSNLKKLTSTTSYDMWIAWIYAIISLLATVTMYGLSKHVDAGASETIASLHSPGP